MFFFFAIGVAYDAKAMFRPPKQELAIGVSALFTTLSLTVLFSIFLRHYVHMDDSLHTALPFIAASQGLTAFPNIAYFLTELKMANSDLGKIAISSAMLCDIFGMSLVGILLGIVQSGSDPVKSVLSVGTAFMFVVAMAYIVGPIVRKISKRVPNPKSMKDDYVFFFFTGALIASFITEVIGQHFVLGPLVLGLMVPDGQPLGAALIAKLEYPIGKFLYPTFLTTSGLKTNIFKIDLWSLWIVMLLMIFACLSKIVAVICSCRFFNINFHDSVVIGLMLNARGVCELIVYNLLRDMGVLTDQEFALSVISVIAVTSVITPLIKLLYDPTKRDVPLKRRTIQHMKRDAELRVLVCIKNQDNIPSIVNLLEASDATEQSPIAIIAVLLVELVGRATHIVAAHQSTNAPTNLLRIGPHNQCSPPIRSLRNESCVTAFVDYSPPSRTRTQCTMTFSRRMMRSRFSLWGPHGATWQRHPNDHPVPTLEQVVKDGVGLAASLRGLGNSFDLMIVGRHHQASEILMGLGAWSECPELGVVGDILAAPDFEGTASVLVVQQQRLPREKLKSRMMKPVVISHESMHDPPVSGLAAGATDNDPRWEISVDRDRV
ncbi:hypothetical protein DH2020_044264 [Rehmannia glutinosa]|uniref:Cation/H+ exchanger transmembrane domain-containing protein n=1 Tax=Rehmannia glutinosa TaxID=99300 RepID=A0ABR0UII9_REHGL